MSLRTGGRESVEDTPVTGATEETATDHIALAIQSEIDYDPIWCRGMAREITERLESEGYVIVRTEDALTAEDRVAIRRLVFVFDLFSEQMDKYPEFTGVHKKLFGDDVNTIRHLAAGGQA